MEHQIKADMAEFMSRDISNRVFARMCQILSKYNNVIGISYSTMDKAVEKVKNCDYSAMPDELVDKVRRVNIIEVATKNAVTSVDDFLKGDINSDLCKGLKIDFEDDPDNLRQIIKLVKNEK